VQCGVPVLDSFRLTAVLVRYPVVIVSVTAVSAIAERVRLELVEEQFVHEPSKANALSAKMRTAVRLRRKRNATLILIR
jgi:hypothetical protein